MAYSIEPREMFNNYKFVLFKCCSFLVLKVFWYLRRWVTAAVTQLYSVHSCATEKFVLFLKAALNCSQNNKLDNIPHAEGLCNLLRSNILNTVLMYSSAAALELFFVNSVVSTNGEMCIFSNKI